VLTIVVAKDNFNDTLAPTTNWGSSSNKRFAKDHQETTWYGDWSEADLQELEALLATPPPAGWWYEVYFQASTAESWAQHCKETFVPEIAAFFSTTDWTETGASNDYADGFTLTRWDGDPNKTFWNLAEIENTAPCVGNWENASTGPGDIKWNSALLDAAVIDALINDPLCRGLRAHDAGVYCNDQTLTREKWGSPGPGLPESSSSWSPSRPH
jgi:hypothetical protein